MCVRPAMNATCMPIGIARAMEEGWIKPCSTLSVRPTSPRSKRLACEGSGAEQLGLF